jgi:hypothetical protein
MLWERPSFGLPLDGESVAFRYHLGPRLWLLRSGIRVLCVNFSDILLSLKMSIGGFFVLGRTERWELMEGVKHSTAMSRALYSS